MAEIASTLAAGLLAQVPPPDQPGVWGQAWPFVIAGLVILAVVIWGLAGGIRRRREGL